ncbi:MAG: helix-turn-helix domain-containing protein [Nitrospira sp.]|nr:helix-turn-helix domain-containing protein [Nitrospira sp.]MDH4243534.1 helix-turn-helix domain-containing protein [Nitrospira sp.]MDH4355583.1 helix-turn-helix domain-containing protein [Nitrospira sp.]MDH5318075.1 helix-turn-helix domain-containing protein [Nitrospira sp.]
MNDPNGSLQNRQSFTTEKYSPDKIMKALRASRGMIATAARLLGCTRQTIYNAIDRHPEIENVVAGERELMLDVAELKLQEAIDAGESWAVKFYLVTQGHCRGYIERQRVDLKDEKVTVIIDRTCGGTV